MHARHALASSVLPALLLLLLTLISIVVTLLVPPPSSSRQLPFFRTAPAPPQLVAAAADDGIGAGAGDCDYSDGEWVRDEGATAAGYGEDCPFLDPGFRCARNGRRDTSFRHWRWQPRGRGGTSCHLPEFNASEMLERSRNGRIVFAGDSIGRNQWESMLCMLARAVPPDANGSSSRQRIYERSGKPLSRHKGYLSMVFADYNLSVEYYRAPFLVLVDRFSTANSSTRARGAVRLDALPRHAARWAGADLLVLNTGHWWNLHKTIKSGNYFMVGDRFNVTTDIGAAFRLSMETVKRWAGTTARLANPGGHVFFRSFSPSHYGTATWDTGGSCAGHRDPAAATGGESGRSSWMNAMVDSSLTRGGGSMKQDEKDDIVLLLNVTYMTGLRRDGHPSRHREPGTPPGAPEDCSHWCLPGVPDAWNQLLYAQLLAMGYDTRRS